LLTTLSLPEKAISLKKSGCKIFGMLSRAPAMHRLLEARNHGSVMP